MSGFSQGDSRRLLILVDDDADDLMLFQRALRKAGTNLHCALCRRGSQGARIALALWTEVASVCLVSDSKLQDMSGFDLLKRVKEITLPIPVKFAFLIGNTKPFVEARPYSSGADAFFVKPSSFADLVGIARGIANLAANSQQGGG